MGTRSNIYVELSLDNGGTLLGEFRKIDSQQLKSLGSPWAFDWQNFQDTVYGLFVNDRLIGLVEFILEGRYCMINYLETHPNEQHISPQRRIKGVGTAIVAFCCYLAESASGERAIVSFALKHPQQHTPFARQLGAIYDDEIGVYALFNRQIEKLLSQVIIFEDSHGSDY